MPFILPELVLVFFSFIILMGSVFSRRRIFPSGALAFSGVVLSALIFLNSPASSGYSLFFGLLTHDPFAVFFRGIILLAGGITILLSLGYTQLAKEDTGEYYFFLLTIAASMMLAVASHHLLMIYLTVEAVSIVSYILVGYLKRNMFSSEAGIKYFLFGAVSTGIMLYGMSLVYGLFGTLDWALILQSQAAHPVNEAALFLALILVFAGFCFKCSLAPFHMWTPDVYEGAPTPVAALLSVGSKAVGFALILRIFVLSFPLTTLPWTPLAGAVAVLTMTAGNLIALRQNNIKRLLAYSTIAQAGYILVGLTLATPLGIKAALFYIVVYTFMNLSAFGAVILIANSIKSEIITDYSGLYKNDPWAAVILAVSLFSLAGIPPLAGFLAKFLILAAAVEGGNFILAIAAVVNSVIAFYYYARVVKFMFFREPNKESLPIKSPALKSASIILAATNVILGIWPHPVIHWLTNVLHLGCG